MNQTQKCDLMLKDGERIDDLQRKGYRIIQDPSFFCFGSDAVLLSGFAKLNPRDRVLDLGTGTGVIPILLAARHEGPVFTGLEINPRSADMARRSVALNGLEERIGIVEGDIKAADTLFPGGSFDVIVTNPPYMAGDGGLKNPSEAKAAARHEVLCTIDDVLRVSAALLKSGGSFYMVHRPHRLAEITEKMRRARIEPKILRLVHPHAGDPAKMFLIKGTKDGGQWLQVERPLIIFDENGERTEEVRELYGSE